MNKANIGHRLKELREDRQLTMDMLVEDINIKYGENINKSMLSRWESNKNDPSLHLTFVLADYYSVSVDYLLSLTDVKTPVRLLTYGKKISEKIGGKS